MKNIAPDCDRRGEKSVVMGLFSNMYTKEGPGVRKDQPPKKGVARFFEIVFRDYGHLLKLNFLFLACCLPMLLVVLFGLLFHQYLGMLLIAFVLFLLCAMLVGPAMTCLHGLTVKTVRDEPCYLWHEFKKCWKGNWRQSIPAGLIFCTLLAMECIAAWYYFFGTAETNLLLVAFVSFSVLMLVVCWLFTTLQMLFLDMPLGGMLRNSLLILFGYAKRTLPAGLIVIGVTLCVLLFVPVPLLPLLLLLGLPALLAVVCDMWAWPVMEQAFHISEQQAARRAEREAQ